MVEYIPPDEGEPRGPQVIQQENIAPILDKINPANVAETIKHDLLGEKFDTKTEKWAKAEGTEPFLSKVGATKLCQLMSASLTNNAVMSNLDKKKIAQLTVAFGKDIARHMCNNGEKYEINSNNASVILRIFTDNYFLCLRRAMDQGERVFLKKTISSHETISPGRIPMPQEKKKGWFGRL